MLPKWLMKDNKRKQSQKQEKRIAKKHGGRTQVGSGMFSGDKGDVKLKFHLLELKRTDKQSMILHNSDLEKIRGEAIKEGRIPAMQLDIGGRSYYLIEACYLEG